MKTFFAFISTLFFLTLLQAQEMHFKTSDGVDLYVTVKGKGTPCLNVHGSPGAITPFWEHTANSLRTNPGLFLFQVLRAMIWTLYALPVIFGSKLNAWWTALLVALLFSIPQNLGHIMENSLIPGASVRLSHFIETASSSFIFGLIVVWLLHRKHESLKDLLGSYLSEKSG